MDLFAAAKTLVGGRTALACGAAAAALGALALANRAAARRAEREHPPRGGFIEVDGVRLHYTDRGAGQPIVLIHGNAVSGDDYDTSGVAGQLLRTATGSSSSTAPASAIANARAGAPGRRRSRPNCSTRRSGGSGIERPVVVGHSWGAIVALSLADRHPADTAGLVLLSGYYFWTLRPDVLLVSAGAIPVLGDILRYTVSPWLGRLLMPLQKRAMFSPAPVTARFKREYSDAMALRPSQIRATSVDGALMIPGALRLRRHYDELRCRWPSWQEAATRWCCKRSAERLHAEIPGSVLRIVDGAGHMVHHSAPHQVVEAVRSIAGTTAKLPAGALRAPVQPLRAASERPASEGLARAA